ncbi:hypothetical protein BDN72DRAFT_903736 [Pluteus cervinus]|uniref:Uncharacterized protein n=1 Tax=Pluteus cervinus TaxID=181527 RepID=A0ACD3A8J0_9AGAR|nr:hypothetical protein BDN72DRAFT_903736 [Pluteus cervinus]
MSHFTKLFCLLTLAISASAGLIARDTSSAPPRRYDQVFSGSTFDPNDPLVRDAAIEGDGYLTFTITEGLAACWDFCDSTDGCIFVNRYFEYRDPNLPQPAVKCSAYSQVHGAEDKTNFGGQILDPRLGPTFIQASFGYAAEI